MAILIVVAHPDDEVLGCGGTAAALAAQGEEVRSCILSGDADARQDRPDVDTFHSNTNEAQKVLGFQPPVLGNFPNIKFNSVPHLELVQFIEAAIEQTQAEIVFTHHPNDINDDHKQTSSACQAAVRLFQRRIGVKPLRALYFMEILSATDWTFPSGSEFRADTFYEIGAELLERKLVALRSYQGVMRDFPHPRSEEILKGLAAYRGGQAGMRYAEAFQTAFHALGRK
ncbi:MAG TPA: PIG-L deacetylase family protein [Pyrinomonadaceae bacterium]|jgi:LmbE family N-acetylglucosaminyl deacetylase|nr:PIG-L deacetylase family protein [Pyrinomonadaceae bacterium]